MATRTQFSQAASFTKGLYVRRASVLWHGYVRRDPMMLMQLGPGRDDPYRIYTELRAQGPLLPTRLGNWVTTSHSLCSQVLRDRTMLARPADSPVPTDDEEINLSFLDMNDPDHARLRRIVAPAFGPRQIAGFRPAVEATVHRLIDGMLAQDEVDLVSAFAAPLPIAVITGLLGVPDADAAAFARYGALIGGALDGIRSRSHARARMAADRRLRQMFDDLFELRRREPADDVVSRVVHATDDVAARELFPLCVLLLVAGFETTVNLIGNGVLALTAHPEQWELLRAAPSEMAAKVVEETLRWDPPVQRTGRTPAADVDLAGQRVRTGQYVITLIGAANRDPEVYRRPDEFDLTRSGEADHLAFSAGVHYCVGAPLARMETAVAFAALAERLPGLQIAGRVRRRNATTIRGPLILPVRTR